MPSDAAPDQSAADGYLQRAHLLAELGRYDEGIGELTALIATEPAHVPALTMLARMHLAADRPSEALAAAEAAVTAAGGPPAPEPPAVGAPADETPASDTPGAVPPAAREVVPALVARGFALLDLERWKTAAATADEILARAPGDAYAQRSAAAVLSASRNGQAALDAAWRGVELSPDEPEAHLVLGLVAVRLQLFDLAERAYREALRLDPGLGEAGQDMGVARLERRRYAETLEHLTAMADLPVARPDPVRTVDAGIRRLLLSVAGLSLIASVLVAALAPASPGASRLFAVLAVAGVAVLLRRPVTWQPGLREAMSRGLVVPVYAAAAAVVLLLVYALVGGPLPLVGAITASVVAGFTAFARR
ncbi:tetratricopeptide repeat protein [Micromonospora aurantiaca (nom. illeg.)]|uniref:tetratricopeptide repeat protein n=1 Tax=Micromonospora aurantiaca (nom. illeg.) TaxID=47850 RepID=UPI0036C7FCC4